MKLLFPTSSTRWLWVYLLLSFLPAAQLNAQGTFIARTLTGSTTQPRITINTFPALPADNVFVEILVPAATSLTGLAATPFQLTETTDLRAGTFSMGTLTANGLPPGTTTLVIVRAWDMDTGANFDAARVRASLSLSVVLGGNPGNGSLPLTSRSLADFGFPGMNLDTAPFLGTIDARTTTFDQPRIRLNGVNVLPEDHVKVEFLVEGAESLSGPAATPFFLTQFSTRAGLFSMGTLTVNGIPAGSEVLVTIRAWDNDTGTSFDTATVKCSSTFDLITGGVTGGGIPSLPTSISLPGGFPGLDLGANPPPVVTTAIASQSVLAGTPVTLSTTPSGAGPFTFRWTKNGIVIPGATSSSLTFSSTSTADSGQYAVTVINGCSSTVRRATLNVVAPVRIQALTSQSVCAGSSFTFSTVATGTGPITFAWTKDGVPITGATSSSLTFGSANAGRAGTYCVTATATLNAVSSCATLTVVQPGSMVVSGPTSQTLCSRQPAAFAVLVTGDSQATFQWFFNGAPISGATSPTLNLGLASPSKAGQYCVVVHGTCETVTNCATLTVTTPPTITCPANLTFLTASPLGTVVNFTPTTTSGGLPTTVTCTPASGSRFPLGVTTVTCTASNACGTATCSFTVSVQCPNCLTVSGSQRTAAKASAAAEWIEVIQSAESLEGPWQDEPTLHSGDPIPVGESAARFFRTIRRLREE